MSGPDPSRAKEKAVVLLSGGLDSSTNLFEASEEYKVELALTFDYGQKAAAKEIQSARALCEVLDIPHRVLSLPWIKDFGSSSLITDKPIPVGSEVQIDSLSQSQKTARSVWVPNRNGIFLNIAAGFAESLGAQVVVPGFNKEEATTFPDNSKDFMSALDGSFAFSTANAVTVKCFTVHLDKTEIVARALKIKLPLNLLWPCYFDGPTLCGKCESCLRFNRALEQNGISLKQLEKM